MLLRIVVVYLLLGLALEVKFVSVASFKELETIPEKVLAFTSCIIMAPIWFAQGFVIGIKELIKEVKDSD